MEKFKKVIAKIAGRDKEAVISFLRSEGIAIPQNADVKQVVEAIFGASASQKFRDSFASWAEDRYSSEKNFSTYAKASGNFDPMKAQSGGAELNLSGIDSYPTGSEFNMDIFQPTAPVSTGSSGGGTAVGNTLRGIDWSNLLNTGIGAWLGSSQSKKERELLETKIQAEKDQIQAQIDLGKLGLEQGQQQLKALELQASQGQTPVALYVVGGVVLLGAIGTAIYFATRK